MDKNAVKQFSVDLDTQDFINAIKVLGISGSEICIHSSMKSFGADFKCGIKGIIDSFLIQKCTIMVPTFSDIYEARPVKKYMPERNGAGDYSYFLEKTYSDIAPFDVTSKEISVEDMGLFAQYVLNCEKCVRGNHPLNSFTALGDNAKKLVGCQTHKDVYAPMRQLCDDDGYVLLMGVGLDAATIIHYVEQVVGRTLFIRWAYNKDNNVIPVSSGGCSEGFGHFNGILSNSAKKVKVANSEWVCFKAKDIVDICTKYIKGSPNITHCDNKYCDRCNDAICGGPILNDDFWDDGSNDTQ
ncbi:hypothetical protein IMSAGC019_00091 [Lachnospiraceae bacterium]|nr:hypothetical protein IMSAGC019_00091 [Lachnospiraceae bacterium]